jgi:hypothetical protein
MMKKRATKKGMRVDLTKQGKKQKLTRSSGFSMENLNTHKRISGAHPTV